MSNVIKEIKVVINQERSIDFWFDSGPEYKCYGVSLFSISLLKMYGEYDYLISNERQVEYLNNLLITKPNELVWDNGSTIGWTKDYNWQYELQIETDLKYFYIEKWGLCTKIEISDYQKILNDIDLALNRWSAKSDIIFQIKSVYQLINEPDSLKYGYAEHQTDCGDYFRIIFNKNDYSKDVQSLLDEISYPKHVT